MIESQSAVQPTPSVPVSKPKTSWKKVVFLLVVGGGVFYWVTASQRNEDSEKIFEEVTQQLSKLPAYSANVVFLGPLLKQNHGPAFSQAYTSRGKRTPAKFDWTIYYPQFLDPLIAECNKAGRKEIADQLALFKKMATKPK